MSDFLQKPLMVKNQLAEAGLNLAASIEVSKLPPEIITILIDQNIPFEATDILCLIANGGRSLWTQLSHPLQEKEHPIDQFSIAQIKNIDREARILYPHPQWIFPLQRLGRFLNLSRPSPIGIDINDEYGLWFAFRVAFLTSIPLNLTSTDATKEHFVSPCTACLDKPCIKTKAATVLAARLACPYQRRHQYTDEQINYHQKILARFLCS